MYFQNNPKYRIRKLVKVILWQLKANIFQQSKTTININAIEQSKSKHLNAINIYNIYKYNQMY